MRKRRIHMETKIIGMIIGAAIVIWIVFFKKKRDE